MAKKRKAETRKLPLALRQHIEGFGGSWRYSEWCRKHGFAANIDKTPGQIALEASLRAEQLRRVSENAKFHRNPKKWLQDIFSGALHSSQIERPNWKALAIQVERSDLTCADRASLLALFLQLMRATDILMDSTIVDGRRAYYFEGLIRLHAFKDKWIRDLEEWRPASHNAERQFHYIARHLLARYPLPAFFDQVWLLTGNQSQKYRHWYVHVGAGGNIRDAETPVPLTKAMAHHMMQAPDDYSMEAAIRWGQIHALGGDSRLVNAILGTRLATKFSDDEFWLSVMRFFVENPLLERRHVGPIVDYLHSQKFESLNALGRDNMVVTLPPAQPNLTMRGRTAVSLLSQVRRWHRALGRENQAGNTEFKPSGLSEFKFELRNKDIWTIRELHSTSQLCDEGRKMKHCVLSYAQSCAAGENSIWSMELHSATGHEKRQTIQLTKAGQIVQSRGKLNRLPTAEEFSVLQRWALQSGLTIASYVKFRS